MKNFTVNSAQGAYSVEFFESLRSLRESLGQVSRGVVILDAAVARIYKDDLSSVCQHFVTFEVEASENEKTLEGCARVLGFLQAQNASRQTHIIGIGGGVIQDIVTFCAHVYYRGLSWTFVPTTLLGMSDSCIGAKASINFNGYKNQLGVFHAPSCVKICAEFIHSLPEREVRSGYGEIIKLHFAGSKEGFMELGRTLHLQGFNNPRTLEYIEASLRVKKGVIEIDEFDVGLRRTLNYGHTFGHALESVTDHGIPHGLAVVWGMDLINYIAWQRGLISAAEFGASHEVFAEHFRWQLKCPIVPEALIRATARDKKSKDGRLTLVLPRAIGQLDVFTQDYGPALDEWVRFYLTNLSIVGS